MPLRIEDYALIGDCETAALVGRDGSVDWLCLPRFDAGACFAALLGTPDHGRWLLGPEEPAQVRRAYWDGTLVLETEFTTPQGIVAIIDCMPPGSSSHDLIRIVEGRQGQVRMRMDLAIRFDYGSIVPWVQRIEGGISAVAGPDALRITSTVPFRGHKMRTEAHFVVNKGDRFPFCLAWHPSHVPHAVTLDPFAALQNTRDWWLRWSSQAQCAGPYKDAILRSLITLKALTYAPTGGIVAAPTTSLPEVLGGSRNWDYRHCWLRDATFTLYTLLNAGYEDEAVAWRNWLLRAVAGNPGQTHIMYGIGGERRLTEMELPWLPGYEGASPVRIGNAAFSQLQLDVYGETLDTLHLCRRRGLHSGPYAWHVEEALVGYVEKVWNQPDEGIWEIRGPRRHFTHSKVMAWVALDRAIKAIENFGMHGPVERWRSVRETIHQEICHNAFDHHLNSFVQYYGSKRLDASLLIIPEVGFLPVSDPRVKGTIAAVEQRLLKDGFVRRYVDAQELDGLDPSDSAFLACSFWLADTYVLAERLDEAGTLFERLISLRNDVGLLSEDYDPTHGRLTGNFPQALSHIALVNTARNLIETIGPARHRQLGGVSTQG